MIVMVPFIVRHMMGDVIFCFARGISCRGVSHSWQRGFVVVLETFDVFESFDVLLESFDMYKSSFCLESTE